MFSEVSVGVRGQAAVLVVGRFQGEGLDKPTRALDKDASIARALRRAESTGDLGQITEVFPRKGAARRALLVGLGPRGKLSLESLRSLGATIERKLASIKEPSARLELSAPFAAAGLAPPLAGQAIGEGLGLAAYICEHFKGKGSKPIPRGSLALASSDPAFRAGIERGLALAESTNLARTLSQTPPNIATPAWIASEAQKLAKDHALACRVFRGEQLVKERFEGLINVGKASENDPCLIRLEYTPKAARKGAKPVVLIGKTMTYDSGGLSLKINNSMRGMKRDKDGGCAVLGAMHAIATVVRPDVPVVALLAAAENSISDEAYRPDDVLTYRNGVTVEVTNTDAEGRLVLADALCWACEKENPACIIDLATLTGGVVTALGSTFAGMFCDDDNLRARVEAAAAASGDRVWRLPLHQEYRDMMKSSVADIINSNPNRKAHPIQGAAFLASFVDDSIPWCHLDIAGVHAVESTSGPFSEGATGWGVRLLAQFLTT